MSDGFNNEWHYYHQFMGAGGQVIVSRNGSTEIFYPENWIETHGSETVERYQIVLHNIASTCAALTGYPVIVAAEMLRWPVWKVSQLVSGQGIGAVKKGNKWFINRTALEAYIDKMVGW